MNDKELAVLRQLASKALTKGINHLETTSAQRLSDSRKFEAKIRQCEEDQKIGARLSIH